ncbi:MAG: hypothetical protein ACRDOH_34435, partial [Streptosporangiaceae bacterium]
RARIDDLRRIEIRLDAADLAEELARSAHEYRHETPQNPLSRTGGLLAPITPRATIGAESNPSDPSHPSSPSPAATM